MALKSAAGRLSSNTADACVVAGADSYIDLETLEWLEETQQLHGAGAANNAWGFIPGEAGGAVLVGRPAALGAARLDVLARVGPIGLGVERNLIRSGAVCLGEGLTAAFHEALGHEPAVVITDLYCDMNGEPYRADEYGLTITRTRERFLTPSEFVAPADCWGDVGAASAALYLSLAAIAFRKGYAHGPEGLVWASSDTGERAAATIFPD